MKIKIIVMFLSSIFFIHTIRAVLPKFSPNENVLLHTRVSAELIAEVYKKIASMALKVCDDVEKMVDNKGKLNPKTSNYYELLLEDGCNTNQPDLVLKAVKYGTSFSSKHKEQVSILWQEAEERKRRLLNKKIKMDNTNALENLENAILMAKKYRKCRKLMNSMDFFNNIILEDKLFK